MFRWFKVLAAASILATVAACGSDNDDDASPDRNVVQQAQADPRFSILAEAVVAADLVPTLSGPGPFTVFAPTNEAFARCWSSLASARRSCWPTRRCSPRC